MPLPTPLWGCSGKDPVAEDEGVQYRDGGGAGDKGTGGLVGLRRGFPEVLRGTSLSPCDGKVRVVYYWSLMSTGYNIIIMYF